MIDQKELDRKNFLVWLSYTTLEEISEVKKEHGERFNRMFKEYVIDAQEESLSRIIDPCR